MNYNKELATIPSNYYQTQFIDSYRGGIDGENTMTFLVKDDTDLVTYSIAAKEAWESIGDYPTSFKGIIRKVNGNCFATFDYLGALEAAENQQIA
ncbi:MAG: hypothetical protein EOO86_17850 [Pedobacter sp.]|nr:MAG: hypothetical protein EOO86_17850 [Pedobacter sp.]